MVKIYTKTGDKGETALVSGTRVSKSSERLNLYGEVDELNSSLGVVISLMNEANYRNETIKFLKEMQSELFNIGSNLACEEKKRAAFKLPNVSDETIKSIENEIDNINKNLPELKEFILPGGSLMSSCLHISRCVCRRVERNLVKFIKSEGDNLDIELKFFNRFSDYLFMVSRDANHFLNYPEETWKQRKS